MSEKLKPCPFCGSENVFVVNSRLRDSFSVVKNAKMSILCWDCETSVDFGLYPKTYDALTDEDVAEIERQCIEKWNRRTKQ